jgi:hypothetical protein
MVKLCMRVTLLVQGLPKPDSMGLSYSWTNGSEAVMFLVRLRPASSAKFSTCNTLGVGDDAAGDGLIGFRSSVIGHVEILFGGGLTLFCIILASLALSDISSNEPVSTYVLILIVS